MLKKIISGGQTGTDVAALMAAEDVGYETGGYMPKGFLTQVGPKPEWGQRWNMTEHTSSKYPPRTYANVKESDGTLRIAYDFDSSGEIMTLQAIKKYKKPHMDVDLNHPRPIGEVVSWLKRFSIVTLNVAGNSERTYGGICGDVVEYMSAVLLEYNKTSKQASDNE